MIMFKILGVLLAFYVTQSIAAGKVYAKSGMSGRMILREETPRYFWVVIAIYMGLSVALMTVF